MEINHLPEASHHLTCPLCQTTDVKRANSTGPAVHMQCESCGHAWSFPERRKKPPSVIDGTY